MPIAPLMQRFVDDELARTVAVIEQLRLAVVEQLRAHKADGSQPAAVHRHELQLSHDAAVALQKHASRYTRGFFEALRGEAAAQLAETAPAEPLRLASGTEHAADSALALVDEAEVEADIELSRAAMVLDSAAEWEQREFQTFMSALRGESHVGPGSNPFSPLVYAQALAQAAAAVPLPPAARSLLLRTSAAALATRLPSLYAEACTRLETQGIEPSLYRTRTFKPGDTADARAAHVGDPEHVYDVTRPGALEHLLDFMPSGPHGTRGDPSRSGAPDTGLERVLGFLDQSLQRRPASAATAPKASHGARASLIGQQRERLAQRAPTALDRQVIELLSQLFDALLADPLLPAVARTAINRLQVSVLRLALRSPQLLEKHDHPTWQLMDRIADAAAQAAGDAGRTAATADFCNALVDRVARPPAPDTALYRRALTEFDAWEADRLAASRQALRPVIDALQLAERRLLTQAVVQMRLEEQVGQTPVPPGVRRLLLGPWAALLADAMIASGEHGEAATRHAQTVDQLLWSLDPPAHRADRQRLVKLLPGLLQALQDGMAQAGLPVAEQRAVLDELVVVHAEVMRSGGTTASVPADIETPEALVRRLRDETAETHTGSGSGFSGFSDSVLDLSMLDTVPAELLSASGEDDDALDATGQARQAERRVNALRAGDRLRLWLGGHWRQAQLLWRSEGGELLLFTSSGSFRRTLTRRALERLHAEGLAAPADGASLIQRAVDALVAGIDPASGRQPP